MSGCPNHPECGCTSACDTGSDRRRAAIFWLGLVVVALTPPILFLYSLGAFHAR